MSNRPSILLIDDGELDDVRIIVEQLGVDFLHLRGGNVPETVEPPTKLFIATTRRAMLAHDWPPPSTKTGHPVKIGIVNDDSNTLRNMLRRIGFDLLVRRPVHPYALRLLMLRALYVGEERRRENRVTIGYEVAYRSGLRRKTAVMADLSPRGCRLLSRDAIGVGSRINLQVPKEVAGGKPLNLKARVVRCEPVQMGKSSHAIGASFEELDRATRGRVLGILKARELGPAVLPQAVEGPTRAADPGTPAAAPAASNRRKFKRASYELEVMTLDQEASGVLIGRDISAGGMRVAPHEGLQVGALVRMAIYGAAREEPFVIQARVVRDEGEEGFGLQFLNVTDAIAQRLEKMVASLPAVEALDEGEACSMGSVVSRILADEDVE